MNGGVNTCNGDDTETEVGTIHDCFCPGGNHRPLLETPFILTCM